MLDLMKTFDFEEQPVRGLLIDGEPWMVANDVCRVLDLANPRQVVSALDEDEKGVHTMDTLGGQQEMTIISESGFYALVFTSRKPEAKRFRKWVTSEVLPALRRDGSYIDPLHLGAAPERQPIDFMARRDIDQWLSMIREARLLRGPRSAVELWGRSPLPPLNTGIKVGEGPDPDWFSTFLSEACEVTGDPDDRVSSRDLASACQRWCRANGAPPFSDATIAKRLAEVAQHYRAPGTRAQFTARKASTMIYVGIRLLSE
jgi:prophage antirepressor-like protein